MRDRHLTCLSESATAYSQPKQAQHPQQQRPSNVEQRERVVIPLDIPRLWLASPFWPLRRVSRTLRPTSPQPPFAPKSRLTPQEAGAPLSLTQPTQKARPAHQVPDLAKAAYDEGRLICPAFASAPRSSPPFLPTPPLIPPISVSTSSLSSSDVANELNRNALATCCFEQRADDWESRERSEGGVGSCARASRAAARSCRRRAH